jgi:DNA-binding transcriptional LysR family regulator
VVVARQRHPAIGRELDLETYLSQDHILVSSRRFGPSLVDAELNRKGKNRRIVLRCQNYFAACRVASETDMLLTMPEHYAEMLNGLFDNRLHPFPLKSLQTLDIHMYWHESADNDPPNRWLREEITRITDESVNAVAGLALKVPPKKRAQSRTGR